MVRTYLLRILLLFKRNEFIWVKDDLIWDVHHKYCAQMDLGYPIENIRDIINLAKTEMPNSRFQIMSDVTHYNGLALMTSQNYKTILPT